MQSVWNSWTQVGTRKTGTNSIHAVPTHRFAIYLFNVYIHKIKLK